MKQEEENILVTLKVVAIGLCSFIASNLHEILGTILTAISIGYVSWKWLRDYRDYNNKK